MRTWHLDTDMVGERLDKPDADVAFTLKFPKCRRRTPQNRGDFEQVDLVLAHGLWTSSIPAPYKKDRALGRNQQIVFEAATKLLAAATAKAPPGHPAGARAVVSVDTVREQTRRTMVCEPKRFAVRFEEGLNGLCKSRRLEHFDKLVWLP